MEGSHVEIGNFTRAKRDGLKVAAETNRRTPRDSRVRKKATTCFRRENSAARGPSARAVSRGVTFIRKNRQIYWSLRAAGL